MPRNLMWLLGLGVAVLLLLAIAAFQASRVVGSMPPAVRDTIRGLRHGFEVERDVMVPMPDGVRLAANLYLPRKRKGEERLATVLVRLPYNKNTYGEAVDAGEFFSSHGYAVVVQDMRGRFASEGEFTPSQADAVDGAATLDWIAAQPWSNGRVGTYGCSSLGESQVMLATQRNPHHAAMIAQGAGGAVGTAAGRYTYFGLYEGGIFNLASGFGWFLDNGGKTPGHSRPEGVDLSAALRELPSVSLVRNHRTDLTDFDRFISTPLSDPYWRGLGYISDEDRFATPAMLVNSWQDQTVADTLVLAQLMGDRAQSVIIGPGNHCSFHEAAEQGAVGDLPVGNAAAQPYREWYLAWFNHWLRDSTASLPDLPRYLYYVMAEDRWLGADRWPPAETRFESWYLDDAHGLVASAPPTPGSDAYQYDPMNPTPTRGGPICCTGDAADRSGPVNQQDVESRSDVLVYTSAAFEQGLRIVGPLKLRVFVSSSAPDTDFVAKLVDVSPDGTALNVQEGALRMRYRNGFDKPVLMTSGEVYEATIDMRAIAHWFRPGHRVRLQIASSNFPRLERNLNTGGNNFDETSGVVALNRVYHGGATASAVILPVNPAASPTALPDRTAHSSAAAR